MNENTGHGHVRPRPDGVKARCGGPAICSVCRAEKGALENRPALAGVEAPIAFTDTIGSAIDALNAGVAMVNAASERMKALGLTPQISVNGHDYGDKVSVYLSDFLRPAETP